MNQVKSRITVVETIYHQSPGEQPVGFESRYCREVSSDEQPYERRLKADKNWRLLDCGWLPEPGLLQITNEEGKLLQVIPTDAEREATAQRILEVSYVQDQDPSSSTFTVEAFMWGVWLVLPGESMRAYPSQAERLCIRCRSGTARYTLRLFPR